MVIKGETQSSPSFWRGYKTGIQTIEAALDPFFDCTALNVSLQGTPRSCVTMISISSAWVRKVILAEIL
jgi:hypothetical protein